MCLGSAEFSSKTMATVSSSVRVLQYCILISQGSHCDMCATGVGGSGRQSACKLATFMADYSLYQIEISKNYTTVEWRDDLKKLLIRAGAEGKRTTFLFSDNQIKVRARVPM